jgi:hypothetical protein
MQAWPSAAAPGPSEGRGGVLWHDGAGRRATLWNFAAREAGLPGEVVDLTAGRRLEPAARYQLQACHAYAITDTTLPMTV